MKRALSLLICLCLLLGSIPHIALAAKVETVLFSEDFEGYAEGANITYQENTASQWTSRTVSATSTIRAYKDETGMVMRFSNTAEKNGGPRCDKLVYADSLTNLTFSARLWSSGTAIQMVHRSSGGNTAFVKKDTAGKWVQYDVVMDLKNKTYDVYEDGKVIESGKAFKASDLSELRLSIGTNVNNQNAAMFDDVHITTTDKVEPQDVLVLTPVSAEERIKSFSAPLGDVVRVPADKYSAFTYDCSLGLVRGTDAGFQKVDNTDYVKPSAMGENKLILVGNPNATTKSANLQKIVAVGEKPPVLTVEICANLSKSGVRIGIGDKDGKVLAAQTAPFTATKTDTWDHLKAEINFERQKITTYINDKLLKTESLALQLGGATEVTVFFYADLAPKDTLLLDNFNIYLDETPDFGDVKYFGATGVNWSKIGKPLTKDSYMSNLKAHPRLFLNDRQSVVDKINTIEQCASWYTYLKTTADDLLTKPNNAYVFSNGRNLLNAARSIERRLQMLGFVYLVEQDKRYVERGLSEIRNAGTFPDWSNGAPMIPAELMHGIACFYDWCYDALTPEERTEIIDIVKRQALWQFARAYDGELDVEITTGKSNRTMIENASAVGVAVAFADEEPALAEFLFTNAIVYGKQPVEAYGADGGFPEGASYWGLATEFTSYMIAQLDSAFKDDYNLPQEAAWFLENPAIANTGDYWLYMAGPGGNFNFGDASTAVEVDPTPYFLATRYNKPGYAWALNKQTFGKNAMVNYPHFAILFYDATQPASIENMLLDKTFNAQDDAQVATMRSSFTDEDALYAAMQGGKNTTSHMFKSLGTFVIDANGQRFVRLPGRSDYSAKFDASMYYGERAEGHNTLIANPTDGWDQDPNGTAKFIRHEATENEAFSVLDMTNTNTAFADAKRGMYMTKGRNSVVIQDEVKMNKPSELWWFAHTDADITLSADKKSALLSLNGERMVVCITEGPQNATFEIRKAEPLPTSPRASDDVYPDIYKLAIHMSGVTQATLAVEFVPLKSGETVPESLTPVTPIASWSVSDNAVPAARQAGDVVALLLNSPVVLNKGNKTYVDTENMDVYPFTENGRTLVPVRFISESFDAKVGWDDATQTVTVEKGSTSIRLQIGSDKMIANGEEKILDVPANTYNGRTLIPLRALVEALGKQVMWDDRGLIVISDVPVSYTEEEKAGIIQLLSARVLLDGKEMLCFTTDKTNYTIIAEKAPSVTLQSGAPVVQSGNTASFTIGNKSYTITFTADPFAGQIGTGSDKVIRKLQLTAAQDTTPPTEPTWQPVKRVTFSTGHDKYIESGTIDNIISNALVNRWTGNGRAWICYEFEAPVNLYAFGLAVLNGDTRATIFNAEISLDGENWEKVLDTQTSGTTILPEIFKLGGKSAKYFRINGSGTTTGSNYNSYTEVRFYTSEAQMETDMRYWPVYFNTGDASGSVGESVQLSVKALNSAGSELPAASIRYTSDNPQVATVDASGKVTFVSTGTANIIASCYNGFEFVETSIKAECK